MHIICAYLGHIGKDIAAMLSVVMLSLRNRTTLNQHQFARLIGVSPSTVKAWEQGRFSSIQMKTQRKVARVLGLTNRELLTLFYEEPEEPGLNSTQ